MCTGAEILAFGGDMALSYALGEAGDALGIPWLDDVASVMGFGASDVAGMFGTSLDDVAKASGILDFGDSAFKGATGLLDEGYDWLNAASGGGLQNVFGDTGILSGVGNVVGNVIHDPTKLFNTIAKGYVGNELYGAPGAVLGGLIGTGEIPGLNNKKVQQLANTVTGSYIGKQLRGTPGAITGGLYGMGQGGNSVPTAIKNIFGGGAGGTGGTNNGAGGANMNALAGLMGSQYQSPYSQTLNQQQPQSISSNYQGPGFASTEMVSLPMTTVEELLKKKEA